MRFLHDMDTYLERKSKEIEKGTFNINKEIKQLESLLRVLEYDGYRTEFIKRVKKELKNFKLLKKKKIKLVNGNWK